MPFIPDNMAEEKIPTFKQCDDDTKGDYSWPNNMRNLYRTMLPKCNSFMSIYKDIHNKTWIRETKLITWKGESQQTKTHVMKQNGPGLEFIDHLEVTSLT